MNPAQLLEHFDRISEAPDAVVRLRRFILDLAVRGKLVEQDSNDEPASELFKRIQAEKERCEKKSKQLAPVADDEAPFVVPAGWKWVRIRQITTDRGQTVPKSDFTYIDVTAINKERGCIGEPTVLSATDAPSRARKVVKKGDVLYSCVRPYLLNIAIVDTEITPPPIASTAFAVMNGFGLTLPQYLWTALRSPFMVESVEERMRGQAYPAINDSDFSLLPIPLPPLSEQHRIVAKVDELMVLCDQLEAAKNEREARRDRLVVASLHRIGTAPAATDETATEAPNAIPLHDAARFHLDHLPHLTTRPEHIKQLRQTILNLAVRGRFVLQDLNDEPTTELLKRIQDEKARLIGAGKIREQQPFSAKYDDTYTQLPPMWRCVQLADIAYLRSGIAIEHGDDLTDGKIPYIKVSDLSLDGNNGGIFTSSRFIGEKYVGSVIERGSIVFPKRGGAIATNRKRVTHVEVVCDSNLMAMRPFLHETFSYLHLWFSGFDLWQLNSGTSVPQINNKDLYPLFIPLPPLAEQHRIVAKVDELMALCDQLESRLTATQTDSRRLLEAVLHETLAPALEKAA